MYDFQPGSWQDWVSFGAFGVFFGLIVWQIARTQPK